jgi:hypothetical protein
MRRSTVSSIVAAAVLAPVIALAPACSGAQAINFDADSGGGSGGASGGVSGSSSGNSGGGSGSSSGGSTVDSGSGGVDSGQSAMDSAVLDVIGPEDTGPVEEPMPTGPSVLCPMNGSPATCEPGDYCCVTGNAMQGTQTDNCEPSGTSCTGGTPVRCASPADCPSGQICCGTEQTVGNVVSYIDVVCATTCALSNQRIFCDQMTTDPCPTTAPTCALSTLMPGYNVCQM